MSVMTRRNIANIPEPPGPGKLDATASDLTFARQSADGHFWRHARALVRRAYGPLIVYAILVLALIAIVAIRMAVWLLPHWH